MLNQMVRLSGGLFLFLILQLSSMQVVHAVAAVAQLRVPTQNQAFCMERVASMPKAQGYMMLYGSLEELSRQQRSTSKAFTNLRMENEKFQADVSELQTATKRRMQAEVEAQRLRENVTLLSKSLAEARASNSHLESQQKALLQEKAVSLRRSTQRHAEEQQEAK